MDRVDMEVIYGNDLERRFAGIIGATRAASKKSFGADMAMVWYGGDQHDGLWESRSRTSLYHARLRGADPVCAEHGIMDYHALGKWFDENHPDVVRFRKALGEFAAWAKKLRAQKGCQLQRLPRFRVVLMDLLVVGRRIACHVLASFVLYLRIYFCIMV